MQKSGFVAGNKGYLPQLDSVRCAAVGFVVLGHMYMNDFTLFGARSGVNLFFVLSGFLITNQLYKGQSLKSFYSRRILRIIPLYLTVVIAALFVNLPNARSGQLYLWTFTLNIPLAFFRIDPGALTHLWSIAVEEQFYLVFPALFLAIPKRLLIYLFIAMILIGIGSRIFFHFNLSDIRIRKRANYVFTSTCLDCFGIGAILSFLFNFYPVILRKCLKQHWLFISALIIALALDYFDNTVLSRLVFCLFAAWLIGGAAFGWFDLLENPVTMYVGRISFGVYIFDRIVAYYLGDVPHEVWMHVPVTVCVATLSWHLIERPALSLKRYLS